MLLPIGVSNQVIQCRFVSSDGAGFWLIAPNKKLLGEAQELESHKTSLRELELNSTWLVLEIVESNLDLLKAEILDKNPRNFTSTELQELEKDETGFRIECELYVRDLIQSFRLEHPLIKENRQRVGELYMANRIFPYQLAVVLTCLRNRHVDESNIELDSTDPQKATISMKDVRSGKIQVGLPGLTDKDLKFLSEDLTLQLYSFANTEHNGATWLTDKEQEVKPVAEVKEIEVEKDEKKPVET